MPPTIKIQDTHPAARLVLFGGLEVFTVEFNLTADVCAYLGPLWNCDVLAVHKEKERSCGQKHQRSGNDCSCHSARVSTTAGLLDGAKRYFVAIYQANVVNVHIKFSTSGHSPFVLSLSDGCNCGPPSGDDQKTVQFQILKHLEVYSL